MTSEPKLPEITGPGIAPPYPVGATRFAPGQAVRVRQGAAPGHMRTPWYLRGCTGRVERICGAFGNPEELAYHRPGGAMPLYRVRFSMAEIWGEGTDTLDAEIYEHWLEDV
ncbi:MAG: SH3-like domain-containing protein [Pseudomonadota bacterium]